MRFLLWLVVVFSASSWFMLLAVAHWLSSQKVGRATQTLVHISLICECVYADMYVVSGGEWKFYGRRLNEWTN